MIQLKIFNLSNQLMNIEMLVQFNKNKNHVDITVPVERNKNP